MLTLQTSIRSQGVIIDLKVSVSSPRVDILRQKHRNIPDPVDVPALVDTGADCTLIDHTVARQLGLIPTNIVIVRCLDTQAGDERRSAYDVDIVVVSGTAESAKFTVQVAGHSFGNLPYRALMGRDLLEHCTFYYDGPDGEVTFNFS